MMDSSFQRGGCFSANEQYLTYKNPPPTPDVDSFRLRRKTFTNQTESVRDVQTLRADIKFVLAEHTLAGLPTYTGTPNW